MKRWPILVSFILFVGLCASATFWAMQLFKPAVRPVSMPKVSNKVDVDPEAALELFGGRAVAVAAASNFQLKGVVVAKNAVESVAILVADSKPAEAVRVNAEVIPGVTVKEVHSQYVLLSDGGVVKRVELPAAAQQSKIDSPIGMIQAPVMSPPSPPPSLPAGAPNLSLPPQNAAGQDNAAQVPPPPPPQNPASPRIGHTGARPGNNMNTN
jgi:general secretion pathway protein C